MLAANKHLPVASTQTVATVKSPNNASYLEKWAICWNRRLI